jgi:hypothetical protein
LQVTPALRGGGQLAWVMRGADKIGKSALLVLSVCAARSVVRRLHRVSRANTVRMASLVILVPHDLFHALGDILAAFGLQQRLEKEAERRCSRGNSQGRSKNNRRD